MNNINSGLVSEAAVFVQNFLEKNLSYRFAFHNLEHCKYVVGKAEYIGQNAGLTDEEIALVKIAAWFHDVGYAVDMENHEKAGAEKAAEFLRSKGIEDAKISRVKDCILATNLSTQPKSLMEMVICDADLAHMGEEDYFERIEKMRQEWNNCPTKKISKRKFLGKSAELFETHS